jgi:hypothetical protein
MEPYENNTELSGPPLLLSYCRSHYDSVRNTVEERTLAEQARDDQDTANVVSYLASHADQDAVNAATSLTDRADQDAFNVDAYSAVKDRAYGVTLRRRRRRAPS